MEDLRDEVIELRREIEILRSSSTYESPISIEIAKPIIIEKTVIVRRNFSILKFILFFDGF